MHACPRCGSQDYKHLRIRRILWEDGAEAELRRCLECRRVYAVRVGGKVA